MPACHSVRPMTGARSGSRVARVAPHGFPGVVRSWTLTSHWGGVETQHTLVVHPDLTGRLTYSRWGGAHDLPKVAVEGDALSFDHRVSKGGWEMEVRFEGFVREDTITGDFFTGVGATNEKGIIRSSCHADH